LRDEFIKENVLFMAAATDFSSKFILLPTPLVLIADEFKIMPMQEQ
jgi:hypothetical protein